jgi:hypothetical protein
MSAIPYLFFGIKNSPVQLTFFEADLRWIRHYGFGAIDVPTTYGGLSR